MLRRAPKPLWKSARPHLRVSDFFEIKLRAKVAGGSATKLLGARCHAAPVPKTADLKPLVINCLGETQADDERIKKPRLSRQGLF